MSLSAARRFGVAMLLALSLSAPSFAGAQPQAGASDDGAAVFKRYCALCHGAGGEGNGPAARLQNPRPANLVLSDRNDQYKALIIRMGGAALGRSAGMPPWGQELDERQIQSLVGYLRGLQAAGAAAAALGRGRP